MRYMKAIIVSCLMIMSLSLFARTAEVNSDSKKMDLTKYHDIGNIWLRVSNYGFFGSGDDIQPQWPSLEYPGGSGVDYLYQGALWFGAKKKRRDAAGNVYYWKQFPPNSSEGGSDVTIYPDTAAANGNPGLEVVIDTLVTVGFDGDADLYEFLPAYNPKESSSENVFYDTEQNDDLVVTASIREQRRGVDDDGDGRIDEDPVGYSFPFRSSDELPASLSALGGHDLFYDPGADEYTLIDENYNIWFPLGFVDLSQQDPDSRFNFAKARDDDNDGLIDEDGYPVSEQDYIGYYYDYSPFGTPGQRESGSSSAQSSNDHVPLNIRVRQMSYQWSFGYIKNLIYVEFNITNKNPNDDILYDCTMGIYIDADVGPQAWDAAERSSDDISSYDQDLEFAYTYDKDKDGGLTSGYIGARVVTPNPDSLEYACWTWSVGDGPDDEDPLEFPSGNTSNQKYWLLSGKNPAPDKYISLRDEPNTQDENNPTGTDTRFLFAFYGRNDDEVNGVVDPDNSEVWNLEKDNTMKIVIALFPGETVQELKRTAAWAKTIYGESQTLTEVILPDTFPHYNPPEPPSNPRSYIQMVDDGKKFLVYWDNRSEFTHDLLTVEDKSVGWQSINSSLDSYDDGDIDGMPAEFTPAVYNDGEEKPGATVNPWTAYRLRHDFQGYKLWGRSGSGSSEFWMLKEEWAKRETEIDLEDYDVNSGTAEFQDFGGYIENESGLPNPVEITDDNIAEWEDYYQLNENYDLERIGDQYANGTLFENTVYGLPLYNTDYKNWSELQELATEAMTSGDFDQQSLMFKNPAVSDEMYLALYDDKLIPLKGHGGQSAVVANGALVPDEDKIMELSNARLARRYYHSEIVNPPRGIEYYIAVNTFDRGMPSQELLYLESGRDENMKVFFPGTLAKENMNNVYVVPNPYLGLSKFDGRKSNDNKGDKSRRIWFANLPEECTIKVYTLAGDLVDTIEHNGATSQEIITISKAAQYGVQATGIEPWDMLSRNNQIISSGVYLFSVKNKSGDVKVGKFVIIK